MMEEEQKETQEIDDHFQKTTFETIDRSMVTTDVKDDNLAIKCMESAGTQYAKHHKACHLLLLVKITKITFPPDIS